MATHLRRADDSLRAALDALRQLPYAPTCVSVAIAEVVDARHHLASVDLDDAQRHLETECCQAWATRARTARCGAHADVILDGEGYCAAHVCATCSKEPVAIGGTDCGRCDEKWQAEQDALDARGVADAV